MPNIKDRIKIRYDRLIVIKFAYQNFNGAAFWLCRCDCGKEIIVKGNSLQTRNTKSCGCLNKEIVSKRMTGKNHYGYVHGRGIAKQKRRKKDNYECQKCNKTQKQELKTDNRKLSVHHIDGDDMNNDLENMITLCNSCHKKLKDGD